MPDLVETLKAIQRRIREHEATLNHNEALTRYALIDPLLRALDWDLEEPEIMIPENYDKCKTKRVDYNLGNDTLMLEAKKLGLPLDKFEKQLHEYMKKHKSDYGILTDGDVWALYESAGTDIEYIDKFKVTNPLNLTIPILSCITRQNNFIQSGAGSAPRGSSSIYAVGIVPHHQHAGAVGQHRVVMIINLAVAPGAHPCEILGVAVTVVPLHQLQPAFCHLRVVVGLESLLADRARSLHARMASVA